MSLIAERTDTSLLIEKARSTDSGLYLCIAQNPAGTTTSRVMVTVQGESFLPVNLLNMRVTFVS